MKLLRFYSTRSGKEPYREWIDELRDTIAVAQINTRVRRLLLGQYGDIDHIEKDLYELKIHIGPGYRVYFAEQGRKIIILLCAGIKGSQKRDIEQAKFYWKDYLEQYNEQSKNKKG